MSDTASWWFGTRGYERWIKMTAADMDNVYSGRNARTDQINGGVTLLQSAAGHKEYSLSWAGRIDDIDSIHSILTGDYDTDANHGLIYFIDPSARTRNHFPKLWASPYLCGLDAPSLTKGVRPTLSATPANSFALPARSATFTTTTSSAMLNMYIPVPPGCEARVAFYGPTAQTGKITVTPYVAGAAEATSTLDVQANSTYGSGLSTLSGSDGYEFTLSPVAGTVTLTTALLYIVQAGSPALPLRGFMHGRGHSGCRVDGAMDYITNTAATNINRATLTAHLTEVGSWL